MLRTPYLTSMLHAVLFFMWTPGLAMAAAVASSQSDIGSVSWVLACVAILLSTLSGITALLYRVERELRAAPDQPLMRPWLLAISHMACSWSAGALAFLIGEAQDMSDWYELAGVIAASFMGATFIQAAAEKWIGSRMPVAFDRPPHRHYPPPGNGRDEVIDTSPAPLEGPRGHYAPHNDRPSRVDRPEEP